MTDLGTPDVTDSLLSNCSTPILDWFNREVAVKQQNRLLFYRWLHLFRNPEQFTVIVSDVITEGGKDEPSVSNSSLSELREQFAIEGDQSFL